MLKIATNHKNSKGRIFSWLSLMYGFSMGLFIPIFPGIVKGILLTEEKVSLFYVFLSVIMFLSAITSTIILRKFKRTLVAQGCFILWAVSFLLLMFADKVPALALYGALINWIKILLIISIALFVRDFAKKENLGHEEGVFYKFNNIGYLIGPVLGGYIGTKFGNNYVFIFSAMISMLAFFYFYRKHVIQKHAALADIEIQPTQNVFKNTKEYFLDSDRVKAYFNTVILVIWFSFKNLYVPLYILLSGYQENTTGLVLSIGILPFILLEVKVGEYADRYGLRLPISTGFFIMGLSLIGVFISPYPILNFGLVIMGNIGASLVEPLAELYAMESIPKDKEDRLYGIYKTADPIAYFLTAGMGALTLIFLPFNWLFLVFGTILMITAFLNVKFLRGH